MLIAAQGLTHGRAYTTAYRYITLCNTMVWQSSSHKNHYIAVSEGHSMMNIVMASTVDEDKVAYDKINCLFCLAINPT
jgi:hypothetical protein